MKLKVWITKMKILLIVVAALLVLSEVKCLNYRLNCEFYCKNNKKKLKSWILLASQYFHMPMVYHFDDYEQCMGIYEGQALYCVANTYVKPDASSKLYNYIMEFSANKKQHFRHDKLQRGLCINTCQKVLKKLKRNAEKYFVKIFPMDSKVNFDLTNVRHSINGFMSLNSWYTNSFVTSMP